ncbi:MAG: HAMP domain-containing histidine kinase, partial [Salinibacterium sp.]|nr:HAMP domain-containing histidine kinase [Salinibacterium sp.]
ARLIVITSDAFVQQQLRVVRRVLAFGGAFGLLASAVSGWFLSGIAVEPFHMLREAAGQIRPETIEREIVVEEGGSEVAELAAELEAARSRIQAAFAAQERFLSNVSHELKTPIATLMLEAQTTSREGLTPGGLEFLKTVEEEMRKLGRLVESFLMLTRVSHSGGPDKAKRYPANELIMDAVEDCYAMAEQYGIRIEPVLASDEAGIEAEFVCDPDLMRTLLNNLIRNAVRFSPRGEVVTVSASAQDGEFLITVRDRGPGLAEDVIDHVFDRFAQSPDEVRRERGYGLGLAIAKGIAELHGGDLTVKNHPDSGAEFTAALPLA